MPTVADVLKQSGFSEEQIAQLDPKIVTGLGSVLSAAEQAAQQAAAERERAELERRSNARFYDESIAPALNSWGTEKANLEAQAAFYRTQNEAARAAGFMPAELPDYQAARDGQGRYVAGAPGGTPGSPQFTANPQELVQRVGSAIGTISDISWRHQRLFGAPMPISPTALIAEADAQRMDPARYAEKKFNFIAKENELKEKTQADHDNKIRAEAEEAANRKWAERLGSNPEVRMAQSSRFTEVSRAVKAGDRPDPLKLDDAQRRRATSAAIRSEISERSDSGEAA
jgi:hypothetical protein